jgi:plastocyanin
MPYKLLALATALAALVVAGTAAAASPPHASILIRHQVRGCHTWSVNGGTFKASQTVTLRRGTLLSVTNNDVMPHTLVLVSGPTLRIAPARLAHMGAATKLTFTRPGIYRFTTKAGEDYPAMAGMKTTGEDNVLRLTVTIR